MPLNDGVVLLSFFIFGSSEELKMASTAKCLLHHNFVSGKPLLLDSSKRNSASEIRKVFLLDWTLSSSRVHRCLWRDVQRDYCGRADNSKRVDHRILGRSDAEAHFPQTPSPSPGTGVVAGKRCRQTSSARHSVHEKCEYSNLTKFRCRLVFGVSSGQWCHRNEEDTEMRKRVGMLIERSCYWASTDTEIQTQANSQSFLATNILKHQKFVNSTWVCGTIVKTGLALQWMIDLHKDLHETHPLLEQNIIWLCQVCTQRSGVVIGYPKPQVELHPQGAGKSFKSREVVNV